jgi:signal transduction histidine kinase
VLAKEDEMASLLMTIPGIGYYSALLVVSEIGDINRFPDSYHLCSYAGLVPSTHSSGGITYHGSITKRGSKYLRWIMLECARAHIRTNKKAGHEGIMVYVDRGRIIQVISNLISNALNFTRKGSVTITKRIEDGSVIVSVKDTGSGIDPQILPRLFTKFTTRSERGTGLGLYICKMIIEAHGGKIWGGNNVDQGATFSFSLPADSTLH